MQSLLERLTDHYRSEFGDALLGLVLYGSRARGDERPDSDLDLMLIAEHLPRDLFERAKRVRSPRFSADDPDVSVRALSPEEYERDIAPIDLDIAVDGVTLHDRAGYMKDHLEVIRKRIEEAELFREPDFVWHWRHPPQRPDWSVTWQGVEL